MNPLIKYQLRGFVTGTTIPIAMMLTESLFRDIRIEHIFYTPDWDLIVYFILFFPSVALLGIGPPSTLTAYQFYIIVTAIIANGFLYSIAFSFIGGIVRLFRLIREGVI